MEQEPSCLIAKMPKRHKKPSNCVERLI